MHTKSLGNTVVFILNCICVDNMEAVARAYIIIIIIYEFLVCLLQSEHKCLT